VFTTRFNTRCQMMTSLHIRDGMVSWHPINKQSWILCILYRQCQFNRADWMHA